MNDNRPWALDDFVDALVVELDKTRETLAVKAINKPLSYTVKEVGLDLNIFPTFDGDQVLFVTAGPGEEGASSVSIELGSITDQQVRATTRTPTRSADVELDEVVDDPRARERLRRIGVRSVDDLERIEEREVDIAKVVDDDDIDYTRLANEIRRTRRGRRPPEVSAVSLRTDAAGPRLVVEGRHLAVDPAFSPVVVLNGRVAEVDSADEARLDVVVGPEHGLAGARNELVLTLDPYAVTRMNVRAP